MILRIPILFAILLCSAYLGTWLHHEPGYVLVAFHHWTIESTFWVAMIAIVVFAMSLHIVLSILKYFSHCHPWRTPASSDWLDADISPIISDTAFQQLKHHTQLQSLQACIAHHDHSELKKMMAYLPKDMKHDPEIIALYARYLLDNHQDKTAEALLRETLKTTMNDTLIKLYAHLAPDNARVSWIESLLKKHPHSAALQLCLGQLLMNQQLWGVAKTHLEKSIAIQPSPEAYYALGQLLDEMQEDDAANAAYRKGLKSVYSRS